MSRIAVCEEITEEELMQGVYVDFQFDLCRACQRSYIKDLLPTWMALGSTAWLRCLRKARGLAPPQARPTRLKASGLGVSVGWLFSCN